MVQEVESKDARYDPQKGADEMAELVRSGEVVAVALVGITSGGAVTVIGSESTGQTLNLLAQGIKQVDGTLAPEEG
jgi:hypothetical protein